jgi:hypothetical protein
MTTETLTALTQAPDPFSLVGWLTRPSRSPAQENPRSPAQESRINAAYCLPRRSRAAQGNLITAFRKVRP